MNAVPQDKLKNIAPLFAGWDDVIILSCLQGHMGQAWADDLNAPTVAKIELLGFCYVAGDAGSPQAKELLRQIAVEMELQLNSEAWHNLAEKAIDNRTHKFMRYKFKKDAGLFDKAKLHSFAQTLPEGYTLAPIDEAMFRHLPTFDWADCHCSQFSSYEEFQKYGVGFVVLYEGEPICAASPYAYCDGMIDVQIDTVEEHRQKGIATACCARLILECLDREIFPSWNADCGESRHLAEKLGYQLDKECACYEIIIKKEVLLFLTDKWADWEASYAIWLTNSVPEYTVKTVAIDKQSKISVGGLWVEIDYTIDEYENFNNLAMIILTGGFSWKQNRYDEIAEFVKKARGSNIPIAAICGAAVFLGKHGFLDSVKHTGSGNNPERFQQEPGYNGHGFFTSAQVVADQGFITANETAALEFAREIFRVLKVYSDDDMDEWYDEFKNGLHQK